MNNLDQKISDQYEKRFPLCPGPYQEIAQQLDCSEDEVMHRLDRLLESEVVSRVGAVFDHKKAGSSSLVALAVPQHRLSEVASYITSLKAVNHNYLREHFFNLWFVLTATNQTHLDQVLKEIKCKTNLEPLILPMEKSFHVDLSFAVNWGKPCH